MQSLELEHRVPLRCSGLADSFQQEMSFEFIALCFQVTVIPVQMSLRWPSSHSEGNISTSPLMKDEGATVGEML